MLRQSSTTWRAASFQRVFFKNKHCAIIKNAVIKLKIKIFINII